MLTKPTTSTQPCIPTGSLNRVPALIGWGKGGNVTSAGWQVTLCDLIWHVSFRSDEAVCELLYSALPFYFFYIHNNDLLGDGKSERFYLDVGRIIRNFHLSIVPVESLGMNISS